MTPKYTVTTAINDIYDCTNARAAIERFRDFLIQYHIDTFTSGEIDLTNRKRNVFHAMEWPDRWRNYYFQSGMLEHDPVRLNFVGNIGADFIEGGAGSDTIRGGGGDDNIDDGTGNDYIDGDLDDYSDTYTTGSDILTGGSGDDGLRGGLGADQLNGGDGNDDLSLWWETSTVDTAVDHVDGGKGKDTLVLSWFNSQDWTYTGHRHDHHRQGQRRPRGGRHQCRIVPPAGQWRRNI